jgi:8-oxo-dGTP pyrophosphatase MutT (NUDIX family)
MNRDNRTAGPENSRMLIVVRGNSACGKSSIAAALREHHGRGLAVASQDNLRRVVLRDYDRPGAANIGLIDLTVRYALRHGFHVVLEGILDGGRYGDMLAGLQAAHQGPSYFFYIDVPLAETVRRHATKPVRDEYGEEQMREWYREHDVLPGGIEHVIGEDSTLHDSVRAILDITGLPADTDPPAQAAVASPTGLSTDVEHSAEPPAGPRHTARAILVDGDDLVVIKRTQPARDPEPYWVTVGGGIKPDDADPEAAMRREVLEEIGGTVGPAQQIFLHTEAKPEGVRRAHFFLANLKSMDLAAATGTEFTLPERGTYEIQRIPFTAAGIRSIRLWPPQLADYLADHADGLRDLAAAGDTAYRVQERQRT